MLETAGGITCFASPHPGVCFCRLLVKAFPLEPVRHAQQRLRLVFPVKTLEEAVGNRALLRRIRAPDPLRDCSPAEGASYTTWH